MTLPRTQLASSIEQIDDRQLLATQSTQRKTQDALNDRGAPPLTMAPVTFTAGQVQQISHRLGRQPAEWSVLDVTVGYGAFRRTAWTPLTISIQSQNACTAVFRVA